MKKVKTCSKCGNAFPLDDRYFPKNKSSRDGFRVMCKGCIKNQQKKYKKENRERISKTVQEYRAKMILENQEKEKLGLNLNEKRLCKKCNRILPLNDTYFSRANNRKGGFQLKCKECAKHYYEQNKDRVLNKQKEYRLKNLEKKRTADKEYRLKNLEKKREGDKLYYYKNKDKINQYGRKHYILNKERYSILSKKWAQENRDKVNANIRKRAHKKRSLIATLNQKDWETCIEFFGNKCAYCGKENVILEQEHVIPVIKNGMYVKQNIIPSCKNCNCSKGDKEMEDWYKSRSFFNEQSLKRIFKWIDYDVKSNVQQLAFY